MAGPWPSIEGSKASGNEFRLRFILCLFGLLLVFSHVVTFYDINLPEGSNIGAVALMLWPPSLITFSGALWLLLNTRVRGDRFWAPIAIISLLGASLFLIGYGAAPYDGHAEWGASQGLLPSVTLLSIAGVCVSWWAIGSIRKGHHGCKLYFGFIGMLLLLTFVLSSLALVYLFEFIPMTIASAAIWGWVYDPLRRGWDVTRSRVISGTMAFLATYFLIPALVLLLPYLIFWYYFT